MQRSGMPDGSVAIDGSRPPLVIVRFSDVVASDEDLLTLLATIESRHERGEPFVLIVDCRTLIAPMTAAQRGLVGIADGAMSSPETRARTRMADVLVTTNPLVRSALVVVQWGANTVVPKLAVATAKEAIPFLEERCARFGVELGDDAREWLEAH